MARSCPGMLPAHLLQYPQLMTFKTYFPVFTNFFPCLSTLPSEFTIPKLGLYFEKFEKKHGNRDESWRSFVAWDGNERDELCLERSLCFFFSSLSFSIWQTPCCFSEDSCLHLTAYVYSSSDADIITLIPEQTF